jgi:hypothetical protein
MASLQRGEFRVTGKEGNYRLSGVRADGKRVTMPVTSLTEGHTLGQSIFQGAKHAARPAPVVTVPGATPDQLDDFGLPVGLKLPQVSTDTIANMAPAPQTTTGNIVPKKDSERNTNAKSLAELIGVGAAAGVAIASTKFLEARYEVVPKPSKKHLNDLADNVRKGFADLFGDREVGPWTMVLLLTLGIPIAMWLQSSEPKKKTEGQPDKPNLSSVP